MLALVVHELLRGIEDFREGGGYPGVVSQTNIRQDGLALQAVDEFYTRPFLQRAQVAAHDGVIDLQCLRGTPDSRQASDGLESPECGEWRGDFAGG